MAAHITIICEYMAPRSFLTDFELMIVLAALRGGDEAYAIQIAREIEATAGRPVQLGAVYTALNRLEDQRLVESWTGEPTAERGGRAKRYFRVTSRGMAAVRSTQRALVALWSGLPQLKEQRS
ncbi:MAG: PadR family transcriptional regulator [Vicinamibacterales bacterium]